MFSSRGITSEVISSSVNLYNILVHIEYNVVPNFMLRKIIPYKNNRKERGNRLLQTKTTNRKTGGLLKTYVRFLQLIKKILGGE